MPTYLVPYIGAGVSGPGYVTESGALLKGDPFRPDGWDLPDATWLDLRGDSTSADGNALLQTSQETPALAGRLIAVDNAERFGDVGRQRIRSLLGVQDEADDVPSLARAILFRPERRPGLCKPVQWSQRGIREIWLGKRRIAYEEGGPTDDTDADPTDSGAGSNADPIGGNWGSIGSGFPDLRRVSNQFATGGGVTGDHGACWTAATAPDDQFSEIKFAAGSPIDMGPAVRCSTSGMDLYMVTPAFGVYEWVSASFGLVGPGPFGTPAIGDTFRLTVTGSSLVVAQNGSNVGGPFTDTSLASGRWGIFMYEDVDRATDWQGGPDATVDRRQQPVIRLSALHRASQY